MGRFLPRVSLLLVAALSLAPPGAGAVTVDGRLEPAYGAPVSVQSTQTGFVDADPALSPNPTLYADGSELDVAYGTISDGVLHLLLAGDLGFCCPSMFSHQEAFDLFIDSKPGGQNMLRADNATEGCCVGGTLNAFAGLRFDDGFVPDYWFECTVNMACRFAELPTGGGGTGFDLGYNTGGAPGTLSGGTNPHDIRAAVDNSNGAGVTQGCASSSGAGVTTGVEWAIPLAAIGDPTGCVTVTAFASNAESHAIGNQVLDPLPPGTCALGAPSGVDFAAIAGAQTFTVCPDPSPARGVTWGRIKLLYR